MRRAEAACYEALASLQGRSIPKLLTDSECVTHATGRGLALVTSWEGDTYDVLPLSVLEGAQHILREMHCLGVVHGDVYLENMSYDAKSQRLIMFDFSEARLRSMFVSDVDFMEACEEDLLSLDNVLKYATKAVDAHTVFEFQLD